MPNFVITYAIIYFAYIGYLFGAGVLSIPVYLF